MHTRAFWFVVFSITSLAQGLSPANCTDKRYDWAYNAQGRSPCRLAEELAAPCNPGGLSLVSLPSGDVYYGPQENHTNSCQCNSVFYSLVSACAACQDRNWLRWSMFSKNCSRAWVASYLGDIPVNTSVPSYAFLNVTIGDDFNLSAAFQAATGSSDGFSNTSPHSSKTGRIAGGVIACIAALVIAGAVLFWFYRRHRRFIVDRLPKRSKRQYVSLPDPPTPAWMTFPQPAYQPERRNSLKASQYFPVYFPERQ